MGAGNKSLSYCIKDDYDPIIAEERRSVAVLQNSAAFVAMLSNIDHKFDLLYAKRAFVHHYVAG